jgi:hypothetical protein
MRYLTWRLNWPADTPNYGTGPEQSIAEQGGHAEASQFVDEPTILGYLTDGNPDLSTLTDWSVAELDADEALAFADALVPGCSLADDGRIVPPTEE